MWLNNGRRGKTASERRRTPEMRWSGSSSGLDAKRRCFLASTRLAFHVRRLCLHPTPTCLCCPQSRLIMHLTWFPLLAEEENWKINTRNIIISGLESWNGDVINKHLKTWANVRAWWWTIAIGQATEGGGGGEGSPSSLSGFMIMTRPLRVVVFLWCGTEWTVLIYLAGRGGRRDETHHDRHRPLGKDKQINNTADDLYALWFLLGPPKSQAMMKTSPKSNKFTWRSTRWRTEWLDWKIKDGRRICTTSWSDQEEFRRQFMF